ncbi:putative inactive poly (ADP-ribose) polymerase SRO2-like [Trifolium medium]|uniref:Putative inactive poly (ADP-ribose) polymerase SRO2-like n=1 Tax=Trifolium medium TaxID=97028 RepID=A0A392P9X9_9FABA|nr:putative inactive poly (ADP-ribose) polymerase SRO2-like [Trifolium medium]
MQYQVDKDEEKHLILCRVVLGSMEKVYLECHQTNPSNEGYDTASDDPNNPKWYVVWADDINKRILPVCVVTCKTSAIEPPVKLKISPCELTYASRVYLEIKKRIPIALIPALEDIYGTFKYVREIIDMFPCNPLWHVLEGPFEFELRYVQETCACTYW